MKKAFKEAKMYSFPLAKAEFRGYSEPSTEVTPVNASDTKRKF